MFVILIVLTVEATCSCPEPPVPSSCGRSAYSLRSGRTTRGTMMTTMRMRVEVVEDGVVALIFQRTSGKWDQEFSWP